ncbi:hypothetical protein [Nonomuraea turcica]|uniref:hypothetical protein n=1 Tax=Nonomuraea sp. G32 TaxID=3067274 RepID=UPI00273C10BF|nr:hypothetical protein [Nonomuraea sp. G32]MDP4511529.1 hypothetical protein [Nonomuraea sp. G32]
MLKTASASAIAAAGFVLAVSGCGAGEVRTSPPAAETSEPAAAHSSDPASTHTSESAAPRTSKTTAAGTELKVGDRAILPHTKGTIAITVTDVSPGDRNAFLQQYGERARDIVPYYIRFTIENVAGDDLSFMSSPSLSLLTAGDRSTGAIVTGNLPGCERRNAPKGFTEAGATFETCRLAGARSDVEIIGAKYDQNNYRNNPVEWRKE